MTEPEPLPQDLPAPADDGAADHLLGVGLPDIALPSTHGEPISLARRLAQRTIVFAYPHTGRPGEPPLVPDWDRIPGARGCTLETCGFRDHEDALGALGAEVIGLSTQSTAEQRELSERLGLRFPLLSDAELELTRALRLPTFEAAGLNLLRRQTLVIGDGRVEHVFYPVFPPDGHAAEVLGWLRERDAASQGWTG